MHHNCYFLTFPIFNNDEVVNASNLAGMLNGVEPLDGSNYASWKEKIGILLALVNIDYSLQHDEPKEPEASAHDYANPNIRKFMIVSLLSEKILTRSAL